MTTPEKSKDIGYQQRTAWFVPLRNPHTHIENQVIISLPKWHPKFRLILGAPHVGSPARCLLLPWTTHHLQIAGPIRQDGKRPAKSKQHMIGLCFCHASATFSFYSVFSPSPRPFAPLLGPEPAAELGEKKTPQSQSRSRAAQSNETISQSHVFLPSMKQFPKPLTSPAALRLMTFFYFFV